MEVLFFVGLIILITGWIVIYNSDKIYIDILGFILIMIGGTLLGIAIDKMESDVEKETAIKCLQGNNPYKMEIQYELKDSVYIPVDTIYVKIK